jgi:hypothetical protein
MCEVVRANDPGEQVTVPDFSRSFVTFFANLGQGSNIARIQVDATCTLTAADGESETFYLIAPCRSERMYFEGQLFQMPNYEFCGIFTEREVALIRTQWTSENERVEYALVADRFDRVEIRTREMLATPLDSPAEIVAATLANRRLVVQTTLDLTGGVTAQLEYPVKTMNVTEDPLQWQIDTGPIIVPNPDSVEPHAIQRFDIAHIVSCSFDKAEFVLRRPHDVGSGIQVTDYTTLSFHEARHRFWAETDQV